MPDSLLCKRLPVNARSVPASRSTRYCSGERSFLHSSSVLLTVGFMFTLLCSIQQIKHHLLWPQQRRKSRVLPEARCDRCPLSVLCEYLHTRSFIYNNDAAVS